MCRQNKTLNCTTRLCARRVVLTLNWPSDERKNLIYLSQSVVFFLSLCTLLHPKTFLFLFFCSARYFSSGSSYSESLIVSATLRVGKKKKHLCSVCLSLCLVLCLLFSPCFYLNNVLLACCLSSKHSTDLSHN